MYNFPVYKFASKSGFIFKNMSDELKIQFERSMVERTFKKGQNIFLEGFLPTGIFFLKEGLVKKYKTDRNGKEYIISLCAAGELLGYSAVLCNEPYPDSAAAIETSCIGLLSKEIFVETLSNSNELMLHLLSSLSHEFGVMENNLNVFAQMTVRERLSLNLLILTEKFRKSPSNEPVEILLSREELANMVGTATETLVRLLREMKKDGVIEINARAITVVNFKELVIMSKSY